MKYPEFQAENYDLKHHNKVVDLSQFYRFSGLPNNCTLEMAETDKKRVEKDVVICLQLEDNTRLNSNFQPSLTLFDVITQMAPDKLLGDQSPVVIYMRNEIYGDKLNTTTLRSLGLGSGGRALLRLINSDPESLKVQANVSAPLPQRPKEEEPENRPRPKAVTADSPSFQFQSVQQLKAPEKEEEKMEVVEEEEEEEKAKPAVSENKKKENAKVESTKMEEPLPDPVVNILDERGTIVFSLDSMNSSSFELPDNFFDLTENDVRLLYRDLKRQVDNIENAPLMTAELRKLEENKKILNQLSTYKSCALRIQFPDRHVIQTKFSTVEKVECVMDFVRKFLVNPELDFHLFITPPKTILEKELTLVESQCVPSALLHVGCDENIKQFLSPVYLEKLSSGFGATRVLLSSNGDDNEPSTSRGAAAAVPSSSSSSSIPKNFMDSKVSSKPSGAIPKWFKR
jgi:tether containing UBX domain for GLUT4